MGNSVHVTHDSLISGCTVMAASQIATCSREGQFPGCNDDMSKAYRGRLHQGHPVHERDALACALFRAVRRRQWETDGPGAVGRREVRGDWVASCVDTGCGFVIVFR